MRQAVAAPSMSHLTSLSLQYEVKRNMFDLCDVLLIIVYAVLAVEGISITIYFAVKNRAEKKGEVNNKRKQRL